MAVYKTWDEAKTAVKGFVDMTKKVPSFELRGPIVEMQKELKEAVSAGDYESAIQVAGKLVGVGRSLLARFLTHSVVDKETKEGEKPQEARFNWLLKTALEAGIDEDIEGKLRKKIGALMDAVREEREADFSRRISAYVAVVEAFDEAKEEMSRRDRVRQTRYEAKQGDAPEAMRRRNKRRGKQIDNSPEAVKAREAEVEDLDALFA